MKVTYIECDRCERQSFEPWDVHPAPFDRFTIAPGWTVVSVTTAPVLDGATPDDEWHLCPGCLVELQKWHSVVSERARMDP